MSKCTMSRNGEREGRARGGCGCWPPCRDPNIDRPGLQEIVTDISAVGQRVNVNHLGVLAVLLPGPAKQTIANHHHSPARLAQ